MIWTNQKSIKEHLQRLWERGELLRHDIRLCTVIENENENIFPLRLPLKAPNSSELSSKFGEVRQWIAELVATPGIRIEWREVNHRILGKQRLPDSLWLDSREQALAFINKQVEAKCFAELVNITHAQQTRLLPWLHKRPLQALALNEQWPQLLAVVAWLIANPRPHIYLRQIDLPGIHSKFIETHKSVFAELFDMCLPASAIDDTKTGATQFAARYGFLDKPSRIRFRLLDPDLHLIDGTQYADISLDAKNFAQLQLPIQHVFITENEINFLAFPLHPKAIVIFGAGYGWDALAQANWLQQCNLHYWGDIDTHGFAILNQLRHRFPHVNSFLMDQTSLLHHQAMWGHEPQQVLHDLDLLTTEERLVYDQLRDNRLQKNLRLEQEQLGFEWLVECLKNKGV